MALTLCKPRPALGGLLRIKLFSHQCCICASPLQWREHLCSWWWPNACSPSWRTSRDAPNSATPIGSEATCRIKLVYFEAIFVFICFRLKLCQLLPLTSSKEHSKPRPGIELIDCWAFQLARRLPRGSVGGLKNAVSLIM